MSINDVCFSSNSCLVAFGCSDGSIGVLNLVTKKIDMQGLSGAHQPGVQVCAVSFNNNDTLLASASVDGLICVRNLSSPTNTII